MDNLNLAKIESVKKRQKKLEKKKVVTEEELFYMREKLSSLTGLSNTTFARFRKYYLDLGNLYLPKEMSNCNEDIKNFYFDFCKS